METGNTSDYGDNSTQKNASSQSRVSPFKIVYFVYKANLCIVPFPMVGTLMIFLVITAYRRQTKLPVTTAMALAVLLCTDFLYMLATIVNSVLWVRVGESVGVKDLKDLHVYFMNSVYMIFLSLQSWVQCVVSIERVVAVVCPLRLKTIVTKRRMIIALVSVVLGIIVLISIISYLLHHHFSIFVPCKSVKDGKIVVYPIDECSVRKTTFEGKILFQVYFATIRSGIPMIILLVCSTWIMLTLRKSRKLMSEESQTRNSQELKLTIFLVVIDAIFIISNIPFLICFYFLSFMKHPTKALWISALTAEFLQALGAMTDWLVLLCIGRNIRSVICKKKKLASKRPLQTSEEMTTMQTSDQ